MPVHDWSRCDAGVFYHFHHSSIAEIRRLLNIGLLPPDHYAMVEQHPSHFEPEILTMQSRVREDEDQDNGDPMGLGSGSTRGGVILAKPKARLAGETDLQFYRRKQNVVAVRHMSGDRLVAIVEIVSPGNKASQAVFGKFVDKLVEHLNQDIHLLVLDLFPPGKRNPHGIHAAIWGALVDEPYEAPPGKPLTMAAYEADAGVRAYVESFAVGDGPPGDALVSEAGRTRPG